VTTSGKRGGIYCRLSLATMGDTTNVDDQEKICRRILPPGAVVADEHVYKDNSKSAWQRNRKRPGWDAMLAALQRGELDYIAIYHGDRLVRQPRDMEDLLDVGAPQGVILVSPTGQYNLADPDHQMMLRWMVARAKNEIDHLSRRLKDGHRRRYEKGHVRAGGRGGRAFGFETDSHTHVPAETELIRDAAARLLAGESTKAIVNGWNDAGIQTTAGGAWTHGTFKAMMLRPRYAGLMPDGSSPAAWDPVLDRQTWEGVKAVLESKAAMFPAVTSNARHLLTGIATCGVCGHTLRAVPVSRGRHSYRCMERGCMKVARSVGHLDAYVVGRVLHLLSDEDFLAELSTPQDAGVVQEIAALEARKTEAEAQLADLVNNPHVRPALLAQAIAGFDQKIDALRAQVGMSARARLLRQHAGLSPQDWKAMALPTQRTIVRATFSVVVEQSSRMGPGFDVSAIRLERLPLE
jgi:DNA invertase Pin-like site-specific DNA recombinase